MTRFQATNLSIGIALLIGIAASAAKSQTFDEAVRHNLGAGVEFCARHMPYSDQAVQALIGAGFAHSATGDAFETRHVFQAPADTARVVVIAGQSAPECFVESDHISHGEAAAIAARVLNQFFPGRFVPIGTGSGCSRFDEAGVQIPLTLFIGSQDPNNTCAQTGRTRISIFSAV